MKVRFLIEYEVEVNNVEAVLEDLGLERVEDVPGMEEFDHFLDESKSYTMELKASVMGDE